LYSEKVIEHFRNPRNVGEIPDADGVGTVGNPVCLAPETLVCTDDGLIPIRDVSVNQKVLGHDGRYHVIEKVIARPYKGKIYRIVADSLGSTVLTPDHHVSALKASHIPRKNRLGTKYLRDWYAADELEKGDILLYPVPNEILDTEKMPFDIEKPYFDFKGKLPLNEITVDSEFLRVVGYYLSEGCVRTQPCRETLGFLFDRKEERCIEDVINYINRIFHLEPALTRKKHNAVTVEFHSAGLARFFAKHFGGRADDKHVPGWMMLLPLKKQEALLCGLWRGDGYVKVQAARFATISEQLAFQVRTLLLRQEIIMSFREEAADGVCKKRYSISVSDKRSLEKLARITGLRLRIPKRLRNHHKTWFENGYFHVPVWRVEPLAYDGLVCNLEVEGSHSYVSNSITLHNCGDLMTIYIKVKDDRIVDLKFKTFGCGAAIATSSMITELARGKTLDEAMKITRADVAESLGGLPPIKMHCSNLAADALHAAIEDYRRRKERR
jgi:nitrogen fixation NifU-like protein